MTARRPATAPSTAPSRWPSTTTPAPSTSPTAATTASTPTTARATSSSRSVATSRTPTAAPRIEICKNATDTCRQGDAGSGPGEIGSVGSTGSAILGIAVSPPDGNAATGKIYLADSQNRRVNTYNLDGTSPSSFGSSAVFGSTQPRKIAVDSRGIVYASNSSDGGEVERYDSLNANGGGVGFLAPIRATVNESQTITFSGFTTSGNDYFTLTCPNGDTTTPMFFFDYGTRSTSIQDGLVNSCGGSSDDYAVSGVGQGDGATSTIVYQGKYTGTNVPTTSCAPSSGGGTGCAVTSETNGHGGILAVSRDPATATAGLAVDPDSDAGGPDEDVLDILRASSIFTLSSIDPQPLPTVLQFGPVNDPGLSSAPAAVDDTHATGGGIGLGGQNTTAQGLGLDDSSGRLFVPDSHQNVVAVLQDLATLSAPVLTVNPVTVKGESTATFSGTVDPKVALVSCKFQYSTDQVSWTDVNAPDCNLLDSAGGAQAVSQNVTGLVPNTHYYVRLVASRPFFPNSDTASGIQAFDTDAPAPVLSNVGAIQIQDTSARVAFTVDPKHSPTGYVIQYGTTPALGSSTAPLDIGAGNGPQTVSQVVDGLSPDTSYYYRVVATNLTATTTSSSKTLHTRATPFPPAGPGNCSNEGLRQAQQSTYLPDCRAYEMVTPPDKNNADVDKTIFLQGPLAGLSSGGDRVAFCSEALFGERPAAFPEFCGAYLSQRGAGGWTTTHPLPYYCELNQGTDAGHVTGFNHLTLSPNFDYGALEQPEGGQGCALPPLDPAAPSQTNLYRQDLSGALADSSTYNLLSPKLASATPAQFRGASDDFSHVVFISEANETDPPDSPAPGHFWKLYEWVKQGEDGCAQAGGCISLVSRDTGNAPFTTPSVLATVLVDGFSPPTPGPGAVSADGERLYFLQNVADSVNSGGVVCENSDCHLYMREGGTTTYRVSTSECTVNCGVDDSADGFEWASSRGDVALFKSCAKLTNASSPADSCGGTGGPSTKLYRWDENAAPGHRLVDLSIDNEPGDGVQPGVQAVIGASTREDLPASDNRAAGNTVYFVAAGQIVPGASPAASNAVKLYRWQWNDGNPSVDYLTTLSDTNDVPTSDHLNWSHRFTRVTPDGRYLLINSVRQIDPVADQDSDRDIYRWSADAGWTCISCQPPGVPSAGGAVSSNGQGGPSTGDWTSVAGEGLALNTQLGGFVQLSAVGRPISMSDDGQRIFFDAPDELVPQDIDGDAGCPPQSYPAYLRTCTDVYEWNDGTVSLVSSGTGDQRLLHDRRRRRRPRRRLLHPPAPGRLGRRQQRRHLRRPRRRRLSRATGTEPPACESEGCRGAGTGARERRRRRHRRLPGPGQPDAQASRGEEEEEAPQGEEAPQAPRQAPPPSCQPQPEGRTMRTKTTPIRKLAALCALSVCALLVFGPAQSFAAPKRELTSSFGSFIAPEALAVDNSGGATDGDVYVIDTGGGFGAGTISRFTADGQPDDFTCGSCSGNTLTGFSFDNFGSGGSQIAIAPAGSPAGTAGDIYVAESGAGGFAGQIDVYDSTGASLGVIDQANGSSFGESCGVTTDPAGNIYVGEFFGNIDRYVPTANPPTNTMYDAQIAGPFGNCNVAADSTGAVYAVPYGSGTLSRFAASDFGTSSSGAQFAGVTNATSVAVDLGTDHVLADEGSQVAEFDSSGNPVVTFGAPNLSNSDGVGASSGNAGAYATSSDGKVYAFGPALDLSAVSNDYAHPVTDTSATLNGTVNTDLPLTDCHFEYVTPFAYHATGFTDLTSGGSADCANVDGNPIAGPGDVPVDSADHTISAEIPLPAPGAPYYYRLVVTNSGGNTSKGAGYRGFNFGVENFDGGAFDSSSPTPLEVTQAGAHPYTASTSFTTTTTLADNGFTTPTQLLKDAAVKVPPGFVVNPQGYPQCTEAQLVGKGTGALTSCPPDSQVGTVSVYTWVQGLVTRGIYNMVPQHGSPATFGFNIVSNVTHVVASLRTGDDYGGTATAVNAPIALPFYRVDFALWGVPSDPSHNNGRFFADSSNAGAGSSVAPLPFLTLPTSCTGPVETFLDADHLGGERGRLQLHHRPRRHRLHALGSPALDTRRLQARPTTNVGDAPIGLDVDLHIPQNNGACDPGPPVNCGQRHRPPQRHHGDPARGPGRSTPRAQTASAPARSPSFGYTSHRPRRHDPHHARRGHLPRRRQARHGGGRQPAARPPAERRRLHRQALRQPVQLPPRPLHHRRRPPDRDRGEAGGQGQRRPRHRPAHRDLQRQPAAAVRALPAALLRRRRRRAAHPGDLRHLHHRRRRSPRGRRPDGAPADDLTDPWSITQGHGGSRQLARRGAQRAEPRRRHGQPGRRLLQPRRDHPAPRRRLPAVQIGDHHPAAGPARQAGRDPGLHRGPDRPGPGPHQHRRRRRRAGQPELPGRQPGRHRRRRGGSRPGPLLRPGQGLHGRPLQGRAAVVRDRHPGGRRAPSTSASSSSRPPCTSTRPPRRSPRSRDPIPEILDGIPLDVRTAAIKLDRDQFIRTGTSCNRAGLQRLAALHPGSERAAHPSASSSASAPASASNRAMKLSLKGGTKRNGHPAFTSVLTDAKRRRQPRQSPGHPAADHAARPVPHQSALHQAPVRRGAVPRRPR